MTKLNNWFIIENNIFFNDNYVDDQYGLYDEGEEHGCGVFCGKGFIDGDGYDIMHYGDELSCGLGLGCGHGDGAVCDGYNRKKYNGAGCADECGNLDGSDISDIIY